MTGKVFWVNTNIHLAADVCGAQESGSDVHQHKQALKDLEHKLVVRTRVCVCVCDTPAVFTFCL